jgi:hypothetical protein
MAEKFERLLFKTYTWTEHSFIKSEHAPSERPNDIYGKPIIWKWGAQRLLNEAAALELIATNTTIPVPKVLSCKKDDRGVMRLEMERKSGIVCKDVGQECRMTPGQDDHADHGFCLRCEEIAFAKVNAFVETVVLPQLRNMTSSKTGLNGFVIPPPRIEQLYERDVWVSKQAPSGEEYVFGHYDLSRSNILLHPRTLDVECIVDWECAGYFPVELEQFLWRLDYKGYLETFRDVVKIQQEISLITYERCSPKSCQTYI